jgi:protein involved in polysaccharide export with SLBB domain
MPGIVLAEGGWPMNRTLLGTGIRAGESNSSRGHALGAFWLGLAFLALTAGCYDATELNGFLSKPRSPVSGVEYRVLPPDTLQITSRRVPEINGTTQRIRPDGKINLPLLGEVSVAGKTPKEIEEAITKAAREYYDEADATVTIAGYESQRFYVYGQVGTPGPMPWTGYDTLLDALCKAHPTPLAWPERIIVVRGAEPQESGPTSQPAQGSGLYSLTGVHKEGKESPRYKMTINLMAMVKSGDLTNNILLKPNDVIYVQPNPFAEVGLAVEAFFFPFRAVTGGLGDYRELVNQVRWLADRMPRDTGAGRETLIVR